MTHQIKKVHDARISKADGKAIVARVSVFGNVDLQGDRVMPGAFRNSLRRWEKSGDPIPFIWSHDWADPMAHVGVVKRASEIETGLLVEAEITDPTPFAEQVNRLLRERRVTQFSFAYDVIRESKAEDGANELLELDIIECGPALRGANPEAQLVSAKGLLAMFPPVDARPAIGAELARLKRRLASLLGTPSNPVGPTDPAAVRAEIDRVMAPPAKEVDVDRVADFLREQRELREREEAEQKRRRERGVELTLRAHAMAELSLEDEAERDREYREREAADQERRAAEREAERLQCEEVDAARRVAASQDPLIFQQ